ncbi:MAG: hypothetical protein IK100_09175 [Muribaculaceae bacterium]|nr:hypothetical protein [Muribaculaceae bacterium]
MQNFICSHWKNDLVNSTTLKFGLLSSSLIVFGTTKLSNHILKVARTIANLEGSVTVRQHHIMEAIGQKATSTAATILICENVFRNKTGLRLIRSDKAGHRAQLCHSTCSNRRLTIVMRPFIARCFS